MCIRDSINAEYMGEKIKAILKENKMEIEEIKEPVAEPMEEMKGAEGDHIIVDTSKMNERVSKAVERYEGLLAKEDWNPFQFNNLLPLFGLTPYSKLDDFGVNTPAKKTIFVSQTCIHRVNADRREACKQGKVIDVFNEEACCEEIKKIYSDTVILERNNQKSKILADFTKTSASADAPLFASTKDIYEAAGILQGVLRGSPQFQAYHRALRIPNCPLVAEKCKMLVSGQFENIKLIMDDAKNPKELSKGFFTWKASKKHCYKIWKPNATNAKIEDWIAAFPHLAEYLTGQEQRRLGVFVPYRNARSNCADPRHSYKKALPVKKGAKKKAKKRIKQ
eukprot:TRINITY_DN6274_c0_g1_i6.p1 TRINITY_DN6274_c0_g1~~TRINITY_DN6274_c0_g1_i6.p1  ORF type:complete len:351 (-),score=64.28 TRINITY_DN6274_c0_g1_i6:153-1160(-)